MRGERMKNVTVSLELGLSELFILDHGIRAHLERGCLTDKDSVEENALLDKVNDGIRAWRKEVQHGKASRGR